MKLDLEKLRSLLPFSFEYFDVIDSTNLYLNRSIKEGKVPPALVIASEQTNGQGRIGKKFFSPPNTGLYLTFCFSQDQIKAEDLTARLALAVSAAIQNSFHLEAKIKWVNDIYLSDRKVSGVLCQKVEDYFLFGIGINVEAPKEIPKELESRLGYLFEEAPIDAFEHLVASLYKELLLVLQRSKESVLEEYRKRLVHLERSVTIIQNNEEITGICVGIGDDFSLLLKVNQEIFSFSSGYMVIN